MSKEIPKTNILPVGGEWDWRRRYWDVGDRINLYPGADPRIKKPLSAVVTAWRVNGFGRVVYTVRIGRASILRNILLETIVGPTSRVVDGGPILEPDAQEAVT